MGPFVPDLISDQLNLVVAFLIGIGFGFVLEQAGFSSARRLAGVFYGYDFTVLRVFFTAAVTAMTGVLLLGYFGLLDLDAIYINPTWLVPAIVGGIIMGLGFILGGYCPGTSLCAAAIGKVDAMFFAGGGLLGIFAFGELYPLYKGFYDSTSLGPIKVFESIGMSQGMFALLLIAVAVAAFAITTIIEKRVDRATAPSLEFRSRRHLLAGAAVLVVGLILVFTPDRKTHLMAAVSDPGYMASHPAQTMDADELAFRIVDREPRIQIVDIRPPESFAKSALPGAVNIPVRDLFGKDWAEMFSRRHVRKVIVAEDVAQEHAACLLLNRLGYENVAVLQGGLPEFQNKILTAGTFVPTGSRWDADVKAFREKARTDILAMIAANRNPVKKEVKAKKIQGGC
jgi:rhodanese-related sulfurtransferase